MIRMRSLFISSIGLLAAALICFSPASAYERIERVYVVTYEMSAPDFYIAPAAEHVAVLREAMALDADSQTPAEALGPIYALSLQTDGQSLTRYHLLC